METKYYADKGVFAMPKKNLVGQRFEKLLVLKETDKRIDGKIVWEC